MAVSQLEDASKFFCFCFFGPRSAFAAAPCAEVLYESPQFANPDGGAPAAQARSSAGGVAAPATPAPGTGKAAQCAGGAEAVSACN